MLNTEFNWYDNTWDTIDKLLKDPKFLVENQLNSYDELITKIIPGLINHNNPIIVSRDSDENAPGYGDRYEFYIDKVYFCRPLQHNNISGYQPLYPNEARMRDLTYAAPIFFDYRQLVYNQGQLVDIESEQKVPIWKMPVMVNSKLCYLSTKSHHERILLGECPHDYGGYFIVNGNEKVIIPQERQADNNLMIYESKKGVVAYAEVLSSIDQRYLPIKKNKVLLLKPKSKTSKIRDNIMPGYKIEVKMPAIKITQNDSNVGIPLFIVFRALGIISDKEIFEIICGKIENVDNQFLTYIIPSAKEALGILTQHDAIVYLSTKVNITFIQSTNDKDNTQLYKYTQSIFNREFLSHVGPDNNKKAIYLGYMVRKLIQSVINPELYSDRDHYSNKRVDLVGYLLNQIIRPNITKLNRDLKASFAKCLEVTGPLKVNKQVRKILQKSPIESRIKYALATGNFHVQLKSSSSNNESKVGIAQVLQRLSAMGTISHCRRVQSPLDNSSKKYEPPRRYHFTQLGKICPNETPEGQQVGIVKNFALTTHVTLDSKTEPIRLWLSELGVIEITVANKAIVPTSTCVLINGDLIGIIDTPEKTMKIYTALKLCKLNNKISIFTSIAWYIEKNELVIQTDGGRYCRPLYIIENNRFKLDNWVKWYSNTDFAKYYKDNITWEKLLIGNPEYDNGTITMNTGAMIEYIDTNEEECSLIATYPYQLINGAINYINSADNSATFKISYPNSEVVFNSENYKEVLLDLLDEKYKLLMENIKMDYIDNETIKLTLGANPTKSEITLVKYFNRFIYKTYANYTHCELHPAMWHSIVSQMIPFPESNPAPRNCYQTSMAKQAIGTYTSNFTQRLDTIANVLNYPHIPLVEPRTVIYSPLKKLYHGYQAIVAIMLYSGYNQEDSIIMNQGSIDAGMFNSVYYKTYTNKITNNSGITDEKFGVANKTQLAAEYHAIDVETGYPKLGTYVKTDDIIISKYKKSLKTNIFDDTTTKAKDNGIIDYIIPNNKVIGEDGDGYKFVKVRLANLRPIDIGDKFASRSAQKGTVSMKYNRADMPMTANGVIPEIIMNAHAIPSRMTIGQLLEAHLGKLASISGKNRDATPFMEFSLDAYKEELAAYGFNYNGDEFLFNGQTGEMFNAAIFINPTYYQKLKHMISDKIHSRDSGPVQLMTRQPTEGRSSDGGLRIGEMERDCLLAHGGATYLKEKLCDNSDIFKVYHSNNSGDLINANPQEGIYKCGVDNIYETDDIDGLIVPFAYNLLYEENKAMHINCKMFT
jgi:DNA-directed RNA polymerase II subunit RPB2